MYWTNPFIGTGLFFPAFSLLSADSPFLPNIQMDGASDVW